MLSALYLFLKDVGQHARKISFASEQEAIALADGSSGYGTWLADQFSMNW